MKRIFYFTCFITLAQISCNNPGNTKTATDNIEQPDAPQQNAAADNISKARAFVHFNNLEKIFGNDNYMTISGKDSAYTYFSRITEYLIKSYSYKMVKGDSANLRIDSIKINAASNNIEWNFNNQTLSLENSSDFNTSWKVVGADSIHYQFQKIDNKTIRFLQAGAIKKTFLKTITLSTFLVRSFYDYKHGTKLAFDSTNFTKK